MRRPAVLLAVCALGLPLAACGSSVPAASQSKAAFIKRYDQLSDQELAKFCPALYPKDFLSTKHPDGATKYKYKRDKTLHVPTSASAKRDARAQGCGTSAADGTPPKP